MVASKVPLFGEMAQAYLNTVEVSKNTREEYRKILMKRWQPLFANRPIDSFSASELKVEVSKIEWSSAKTRNNALIPLRGVFELAVDDEVIDRNPADRLKNLKHQKPPVDPFDEAEADEIIDYLYRRYPGADAVYAAYFEFAFWTGMRTSEMLALTWGDLDLRKGVALVSKAQSKGLLNARTKTGAAREVLLSPRAKAALKKVKPLTYLAGGHVFRSPRTNESWKTDRGPRIVFTAALKKLGIRHRKAYNTRHTYATICLMAGMNPAFVASQLGHSITMLLTTYAKWIHGEASQRELDKLGQNRDKQKSADSK
nr:site-specific integrase [Marinobacter sp. JSM 1782161]